MTKPTNDAIIAVMGNNIDRIKQDILDIKGILKDQAALYITQKDAEAIRQETATVKLEIESRVSRLERGALGVLVTIFLAVLGAILNAFIK